jgi:DNA-binding transcriptional LysR family regulator
MNLNQLKIFYSVAKEKSFSLAAQNLFLTQPAVTIQINLLEKHFGVKLFNRKGRNLALTEAGEVLYTYADRILNMVREVENIITDFQSLDRGLLKIATSRTIAKYYIPKILPLFKKRYPNIKIDLKAGNSQEAMDLVLNFASDVGIVSGLDYPDKLAGIPIFADQLVLITSADSRLFGTEETQLRELEGKPLIIREAGSGIRSLILKEFEKEGL